MELVYRKPFLEIWHEEKDDPELGPLSERMGVRARGGGELLVSDEELDAASKDFLVLSKIQTLTISRLLSCFRLPKGLGDLT